MGTLPQNKSKVVKSLGILALGAILMTGGLFLWQNQFNFSFFPGAASAKISTLAVLGDCKSAATATDMTHYTNLVLTELQKSVSSTINYVNKADSGTVINSLRDQAVLAYQDIPKPIKGKVLFVTTAGGQEFKEALANKELASVTSAKVRANIINLHELAAARPGVFPDGFTIVVANLIDPTDGTGSVSACNGQLASSGTAYTLSVIKEINKGITEAASIYPTHIYVVDAHDAFMNHSSAAATPWMKDCLTLNDIGNQQLGTLFIQKVNSLSKK